MTPNGEGGTPPSQGGAPEVPKTKEQSDLSGTLPANQAPEIPAFPEMTDAKIHDLATALFEEALDYSGGIAIAELKNLFFVNPDLAVAASYTAGIVHLLCLIRFNSQRGDKGAK